MELTFLFIYFTCPFYLHMFDLEGSGIQSRPMSAVRRRSYTTWQPLYCKHRDLEFGFEFGSGCVAELIVSSLSSFN